MGNFIDGWPNRSGRVSSVYAEQDPNAPLETWPHYTDRRFDEEQTVYGGRDNSLSYDYSDRLWQWDYAKAETSVKEANASGAPARSANWYSAFISAYRGEPMEVLHVIVGVNRGNGYPYYILGYRKAKP